MSKGNHIHGSDPYNPGHFAKQPRVHFQVQTVNRGKFTGRKFVKRAGMVIEYENYNTPNVTDKQTFVEGGE